MGGALLIEVENVLVQSAPLRRQALMESMARFDIPVEHESLDRYTRHPTVAAVREVVELAGVGDETLVDLATLEAERLFMAALEHGVMLRLGARELMNAARLRSRVCVVTRARRREADRMLALAGLGAEVAFVIAAEDAEPKPAPAPYHAALQRLGRSGVQLHEVIALEDGAVGGEAARRAGVRSIVLDGPPLEHAGEAEMLGPKLLEIVRTLMTEERRGNG